MIFNTVWSVNCSDDFAVHRNSWHLDHVRQSHSENYDKVVENFNLLPTVSKNWQWTEYKAILCIFTEGRRETFERCIGGHNAVWMAFWETSTVGSVFYSEVITHVQRIHRFESLAKGRLESPEEPRLLCPRLLARECSQVACDRGVKR